jgi:uncharacterized membrane protein YidH (DUF202 family)
MPTINHFRVFLSALRTAIIVVSGFIAYEILVEFQKMMNVIYPNSDFNFTKRKLLKLFLIFLIDLFLIYSALLFFNIEL